jgi:hypothetical protein
MPKINPTIFLDAVRDGMRRALPEAPNFSRPPPPSGSTTQWSETWVYSFQVVNLPFAFTPRGLTYAGAAEGKRYDRVSPVYGLLETAGYGAVFELVHPPPDRPAERRRRC